MSQEEAALLSIRAPHRRPLVVLSQRFRSCAGASVLLKTPRAHEYPSVRVRSREETSRVQVPRGRDYNQGIIACGLHADVHTR